MTRLQVADLTSGVGALVVGLGLGALWSEWLTSAAGLIAAVGVVMHGFGMWDKHRRESDIAVRESQWTSALYWGCWLLLAAVLGFLVLRLT